MAPCFMLLSSKVRLPLVRSLVFLSLDQDETGGKIEKQDVCALGWEKNCG